MSLARVTHTRSLAATSRYILQKPGAQIVDQTIPGLTVGQIVKNFEAVQSLNDKAKVQGLHFSLSFQPQQKLSNEQVISALDVFIEELAKQNLFSENHPFIAVRHTDTHHAHAHLLISRVGYDGSLLPLSYTFLKSKTAAAAIAQRLDWIVPTSNHRSLWFDASHLAWMRENQCPTSHLQRWANSTGIDLSEWNVEDWQRFSQHPGVVLSELEQQQPPQPKIAIAPTSHDAPRIQILQQQFWENVVEAQTPTKRSERFWQEYLEWEHSQQTPKTGGRSLESPTLQQSRSPQPNQQSTQKSISSPVPRPDFSALQQLQLERVPIILEPSSPKQSTPSRESATHIAMAHQLAPALAHWLHWWMQRQQKRRLRGNYWDVDFINNEDNSSLTLLHKETGLSIEATQTESGFLATFSQPPVSKDLLAMHALASQLQNAAFEYQQKLQQQQQRQRSGGLEL